MITQELRNFTDKESGDITKIMQACTVAQENTGKLIENAISQTLTKSQGVTPPNPTTDSRAFGTNHASNSSYETNWTLSLQTNIFGITQQSNNNAYHSQRPYETPTSPHAYVNQQPPNPIPFDINQSVVKLFKHQTELIYTVLSSSTNKLQMLWKIQLNPPHSKKINTLSMIYLSLKLKIPNLLMTGYSKLVKLHH